MSSHYSASLIHLLPPPHQHSHSSGISIQRGRQFDEDIQSMRSSSTQLSLYWWTLHVLQYHDDLKIFVIVFFSLAAAVHTTHQGRQALNFLTTSSSSGWSSNELSTIFWFALFLLEISPPFLASTICYLISLSTWSISTHTGINICYSRFGIVLQCPIETNIIECAIIDERFQFVSALCNYYIAHISRCLLLPIRASIANIPGHVLATWYFLYVQKISSDMSTTCQLHVGMSLTMRHFLYVQKNQPTCRLTSPRHDMSCCLAWTGRHNLMTCRAYIPDIFMTCLHVSGRHVVWGGPATRHDADISN